MRIVACWVLLVASAFAEETAAWQLPVERLIPGGMENPQVTKLDEPPGESVFFQTGDELWDLTKAVRFVMWEVPTWEVPTIDPSQDPFADPFGVPYEPAWEVRKQIAFSGIWLVWNARSGQIVARGSRGELGMVEDALQIRKLPHQVITTAVVKSDGSEKELAVGCERGTRGKVSSELLELETAPNLGTGLTIIDLNFAVSLNKAGSVTTIVSAVTKRTGVGRSRVVA